MSLDKIECHKHELYKVIAIILYRDRVIEGNATLKF